ncbi:NAD-dependent epimerase/dehydratase family protein [Dactylosporangium sp. NPDC005555]|uniref:NAD-dependent epimerase/dehydratase family protein n=1 Tax=Dactylosporangium sp. NPDC005555 TaxID=3154889 RepID=UPI0033B9BA85
MKIALTGGTGYIGSVVLEQLIAAGHAVTALVRSDEAAAKVAKAGAEAAVGDVYDTAWTARLFAAADAVVHTAAPGDGTSEQFDRAIVAAAVEALSGTGKPYVHTSGVWIYGDNADITEDTPPAPPALTAWRTAVERLVLDADLVATIVAPGIVYGHGGGIPAGVLAPGRDEAGRVRLVGDGSQHWTTVHVEDVAALYVTVAERGERLGYVLAVSGANPTVREVAEAASGGAGVAPETAEDSRARFGALFADALLLDQQATGAKARSLGWTPARPTLLEELSR